MSSLEAFNNIKEGLDNLDNQRINELCKMYNTANRNQIPADPTLSRREGNALVIRNTRGDFIRSVNL